MNPNFELHADNALVAQELAKSRIRIRSNLSKTRSRDPPNSRSKLLRTVQHSQMKSGQ